MTPAESHQTDPAALFDAIRQGDAERIQALLHAEPNLSNARNSDGATAVLWAVYTRHAELAPLVLAGREPDFYESCALGNCDHALALLAREPRLAHEFSADGFTGLGLTLFFNHPEIAQALLDAGADVNCPSRNALNVYPLHSAVAGGNSALLVALLSRGAHPDVVEFLGATPLHSAAATGNREMLRMLLDAGANANLRTNDGKTAGDLARQYGHTQIAAEMETPSPSG